MTSGRLIAFLRAINVGGHTVTMDALRTHFLTLGFEGVETFIASGNVIFDARSGDRAALERKIEAHLRKRLGYEVATFLRTDAEVAAIAGYQPFTPAQMRAAKVVYVGLLAAPLSASARKTLMGFESDNDRFHVHGREMYWLCKTGQAESKFSNAVFEKRVGVRATFRGANTISRLAAKYPPSPGRR